MLNSIISLFRKKVKIPEYSEKRAIILSYKEKYKPSVFVETGTFMGDTIQSLVNEFRSLYSIELSAELATRAQNRFSDNQNVTIIQGNSDVHIKNILDKLSESALFWLDGHYSGEFMLNDEYIETAKGKLNTPVLSELEHIFKSNFPHIILIDDARLFNGTNDYPTIKQLKETIKKGRFNFSLSVNRDIIRIIPNN